MNKRNLKRRNISIKYITLIQLYRQKYKKNRGKIGQLWCYYSEGNSQIA